MEEKLVVLVEHSVRKILRPFSVSVSTSENENASSEAILSFYGKRLYKGALFKPEKGTMDS